MSDTVEAKVIVKSGGKDSRGREEEGKESLLTLRFPRLSVFGLRLARGVFRTRQRSCPDPRHRVAPLILSERPLGDAKTLGLSTVLYPRQGTSA